MGGVVAAPPPVPLAVAFRDLAHGVLGTSRTIELTADGGKTWKVVLRTPRPVVSLLFFDGAAWARYDDGENLRSTDGGRRWAPAVVIFPGDSVCPQGTLHSYLSFASGGREWALCTTQGGAGNMGKSVYRLDAKGWTRMAHTPFGPGRSSGGIDVFGYPEGIAMARDGFGVIWESRGTLYVTRDGGSHWTGLPKVARPEQDFGVSGAALPRGIACVLLSVGGGVNLIETRDAGRTWHVVHRWP
ncbi:MAG: hypothetical protein M3O89_02205 [Actinomycetota bacterium]|nr:hypothetical protein [Actinomycetota bacterium]